MNYESMSFLDVIPVDFLAIQVAFFLGFVVFGVFFVKSGSPNWRIERFLVYVLVCGALWGYVLDEYVHPDQAIVNAKIIGKVQGEANYLSVPLSQEFQDLADKLEAANNDPEETYGRYRFVRMKETEDIIYRNFLSLEGFVEVKDRIDECLVGEAAEDIRKTLSVYPVALDTAKAAVNKAMSDPDGRPEDFDRVRCLYLATM